MAYTNTNKMKTARKYLTTYLSTFPSVDPDIMWDYLTDDDDFCNEVQSSNDVASVEEIVEIYVDNMLDEYSFGCFSNRDPYYSFH